MLIELCAFSMSAPDLGEGAQGALVVTDGYPDLGYRSIAETHCATEPCSLQSFHTLLQWGCSVAVSLTRWQNLCVPAWPDHTIEDS